MRRFVSSMLVVVSMPIGCADGVTDDPAYDALMRVENAQFVRGAPPANGAGPVVQALDLLTNTIWPGYSNKLLRGALDPAATACALRLAGDVGYSLIVAGPPDVATPDFPSFRAVASFSSALDVGPQSLEVYAIDASGQFGPPREQTLTAIASARPPVAGVLVVTLTWDTEADLDLHVVDPSGDEIFHGAPSSQNDFAPSASKQDNPGVLQLDSNADCIIDGQRQEAVVWAKSPPSGQYLLRVDTVSLCGQSVAHWRLRAELQGAPLGEATGVSLDSDTWGSHGRGAGLLALTVTVP